MKELELLNLKEPTSVKVTSVGCSITASGSAWRFRASFSSDDFGFLYKNLGAAVGPKSVMRGDGSTGIVLQLSSHTGVRVSQQSTRVVACNESCRALSCAEQRVSQQPLRAVLVEYDDGSRYMLIEPLPDRFLSSTTQRARTRPTWAPEPAIERAFEAAGIFLRPDRQYPEEVEEPTSPARVAAASPAPANVTKAPPEPEPTPPAITGRSEAEDVMPVAAHIDDLRGLIEMLNEELRRTRRAGATINLRVVDGLVKAQVSLVIQEEI